MPGIGLTIAAPQKFSVRRRAGIVFACRFRLLNVFLGGFMKRVRILAIAISFMAMLLPVSGQTAHDHIKELINANSASFRFGGRNDQRAFGLRGSILLGTDPNGKTFANLFLLVEDCQLIPLTCKLLSADLLVPAEFVTVAGHNAISVNIPDISVFVDQYSNFVNDGFVGPIAVNFTALRTNEWQDGGMSTNYSHAIQSDGTAKTTRNSGNYTVLSAKAEGEVAGYVLPYPESEFSVIFEPNSAQLEYSTSKYLEIPAKATQ
jgi:hypothetical protein